VLRWDEDLHLLWRDTVVVLLKQSEHVGMKEMENLQVGSKEKEERALACRQGSGDIPNRWLHLVDPNQRPEHNEAESLLTLLQLSESKGMNGREALNPNKRASEYNL
jgi:hypothetical protein